MLVFNEGVPRAGKSYDGVKNHILPAIKKGRKVYARLNGLHHERIAAYLKLPVERVRELLVLVDSADVKAKFVAVEGEGGIWGISDDLKDALIVIDEVHEFYVTDRAPLPPSQEQFFALIGQNGGDVLILTQWIKRVHPAVRARIERKNVFQKLTAVGMKTKYRVTYWQTVSPDKYERVGGKTERYDADIFPLYAGYAQGAENVEVYEEGGTNVWKAMAPRAIVFGLAGLFGAYTFLRFFLGGSEDPEPRAKADMHQDAPAPVARVAETLQQRRDREEAEKRDALEPGQRYVVDLSDMGRPRLAGRMDVGGMPRIIVEWINDQGMSVERLTGEQLHALGIRMLITQAGVMLQAGAETLVVTAWPMNNVVRDTEPRLYQLDANRDPLTPSASEPSAAPVRQPVFIADHGGTVGSVGRPMVDASYGTITRPAL